MEQIISIYEVLRWNKQLQVVFEKLPAIKNIIIPPKTKEFIVSLIYRIRDNQEVGDVCSTLIGKNIKKIQRTINKILASELKRKIYIKRASKNRFFVGILLIDGVDGRNETAYTWKYMQERIIKEGKTSYEHIIR